MLILAMDTGQEVVSIGLADGQSIICEHHFRRKMSVLQTLTPSIQQILSDAGYTPADIELIATGLGPGSFTGLRIGVTTAKTMSYALKTPITGVGTLDAISRNISVAEDCIICPAVHARKGEAYYAFFNNKNTPLSNYKADTIANICHDAASYNSKVVLCGDGAIKNADMIKTIMGDRVDIAGEEHSFPRAASIISCALSKYETSGPDDAFALVPSYVKKPTPVIVMEEKEREARQAKK